MNEFYLEKNVLPKIENERRENKKIVFTNGCFDLIHLGHLTYLEKAKELGDILVLGLNSDASVRKLKGDKRPLFPENERAEILINLRPVDYVVLFDEETPLEIIKKVRPNILVKGGDYGLDEIVGRDFVNGNGGDTVTIPFIDGKSTTNIINKILGR